MKSRNCTCTYNSEQVVGVQLLLGRWPPLGVLLEKIQLSVEYFVQVKPVGHNDMKTTLHSPLSS